VHFPLKAKQKGVACTKRGMHSFNVNEKRLAISVCG
jgi:hypothetical protein